MPIVCHKWSKKLATNFVFPFQSTYLALPGPVPDVDDVRFHLLVQSGQAFAFLSGQPRLVFLVDDLVEALCRSIVSRALRSGGAGM